MLHLTRLLVIASLFLSVSCSSSPAPKQSEPKRLTFQEQVQAHQLKLNRAIGKLTYDEAIQRWGQPKRVIEGDRIRSVVWESIKDRGGSVPVPDPIYLAPMYVDMPSHGDRIDCTFSLKTGLLETIKLAAW